MKKTTQLSVEAAQKLLRSFPLVELKIDLIKLVFKISVFSNKQTISSSDKEPTIIENGTTKIERSNVPSMVSWMKNIRSITSRNISSYNI